MSTFVFIVLIIIGASLFSAGLLMVTLIMASRSSARLVEKYPEIYSEEALAASHQRAKELRIAQQGNSNTAHPSTDGGTIAPGTSFVGARHQ